MSTAAHRPRTRRLPILGSARAAVVERVRPKRRVRRALLVLAILLATAWFAPALVAHTPLLRLVAAQAAARLDGEVTVGSASLGWFSPVVLRDVEVRDANGESLFAASEASTQRTLLGLLTSDADPVLRFVKPRFTISLDDQDSNLERVLRRVLEEADPEHPTPFTLAIEDADLNVVDRIEKSAWRIDHFSLTLTSPSDPRAPLKATIGGAVRHQDKPGRFQAECALVRGDSPRGSVTLTSDDLPLELLTPAFRRVQGGFASRLAGTLDTELSAAWRLGRSGLASLTAKGRVHADGFSLTNPALGGDRLHFKEIDLPLDVTLENDALAIENLDLTCDWGRLQARGRLKDWSSHSGGVAGFSTALLLGKCQGTLDIDADLAAIARALPHTFHLREGIEITGGHVQAKLASLPLDQGWRWNADVRTSRLEALYRGQPVAWDKPLQVSLVAEDRGQGLAIKQLAAESDYLTVKGEGDLNRMTFALTYKLDQLAAELGRFVDIGDWQLAGDGSTSIAWQRTQENGFQTDVESHVLGLSLAAANGHVVREEDLTCTLTATGRLDGQRLRQLDELTLRFDSQPDRGEARLVAPLDLSRPLAVWQWEVRANGRIERWLARAALFSEQAAAWRAVGDAELACRVDYAADKIDVPTFDLKTTGLRIEGLAFAVDEPQAHITGAGAWSGEPLRWELRDLNVRTTTLEAKAENVHATYAPNAAPEITGTIEIAGDAARLHSLLFARGAPSRWQIGGQVRARTALSNRGDLVEADATVEISQFAARYGDGPWVREPQLQLAVLAKYNRRADELIAERCTLTSQAVRADVQGRLTDVMNQRNLSAEGRIDYDLAKLQGLLAPFLGEGVALTGRSTRQFRVSGPLAAAGEQSSWIQRIKAESGLAWQSIRTFGFELGAGEAELRLDKALMTCTPLDLPLNEGRFKFAPQVAFAPAPGAIQFPRGVVFDKVRVTPEMCTAALSYIAPVLAGVTEAEGMFSVSMDGGSLPLDDLSQGDVSGTLTVHNVRVGAGPLVRELAVLLNRPTEAQLTKEAEVPFRIVKGRVYHRDLELIFPEITIRTHGSVGFDRSLAILAEMPVPPKWVGDDALGEALKSQTIRLPIAGTLDQPAIDQSELNRLAAQFIQDTASQLLQQELGRQLDRLLGPPAEK